MAALHSLSILSVSTWNGFLTILGMGMLSVCPDEEEGEAKCLEDE